MITQLLATDRSRHYAQLRNDFRVIELGQLLRFKRVPAQSLRYFPQDYRIYRKAGADCGRMPSIFQCSLAYGLSGSVDRMER